MTEKDKHLITYCWLYCGDCFGNNAISYIIFK